MKELFSNKLTVEMKNRIFLRSVMGKEISRLASDICADLSQRLGEPVFFHFTSEQASSFGASEVLWRKNEKGRNLWLGCSEMIINYFDPQIFMNSVINLFHEARHFEQLDNIRNGVSDESLLYCHLAAHDSEFYETNYSSFMSEIDADQYGIEAACDYIKTFHPEIDAISCIKNYLTAKSSYKEYRDRIVSIRTEKDISTLFDDIKDNMTYFRKDFSYSGNNGPVHQLINRMRREGAIYGKEHEITSGNLIIEACDTNIECDKFASMAVLMAYPEYIEYYPKKFQEKLKSLNMDYFIQKAIENKEQEKIMERDDI